MLVDKCIYIISILYSLAINGTVTPTYVIHLNTQKIASTIPLNIAN